MHSFVPIRDVRIGSWQTIVIGFVSFRVSQRLLASTHLVACVTWVVFWSKHTIQISDRHKLTPIHHCTSVSNALLQPTDSDNWANMVYILVNNWTYIGKTLWFLFLTSCRQHSECYLAGLSQLREWSRRPYSSWRVVCYSDRTSHLGVARHPRNNFSAHHMSILYRFGTGHFCYRRTTSGGFLVTINESHDMLLGTPVDWFSQFGDDCEQTTRTSTDICY